MNVREVIVMLNQMEADGVIERYAIGGAVGATFYLEPVATLDVDVFVAFRAEAGQGLANLKPIFDYLKARGCTTQGEYVVISSWPVQFVPPTGPLVEEALAKAVERRRNARAGFQRGASRCDMRYRLDGRRTKPGFSSSSRRERSTHRVSRKSSNGILSLMLGRSLNDNSFEILHEL